MVFRKTKNVFNSLRGNQITVWDTVIPIRELLEPFDLVIAFGLQGASDSLSSTAEAKISFMKLACHQLKTLDTELSKVNAGIETLSCRKSKMNEARAKIFATAAENDAVDALACRGYFPN